MQRDQEHSQAAGEQRYRCRLRNHGADYAHGEVGLAIVIVSVGEVSAKVCASEERVGVVATGRAYAVEPAGVRIVRIARAIADRRDIEPVVLA